MGYDCYDAERRFIIILGDCAVHRWNSPSSALSALLSVFYFDDVQTLEGAFPSLLSIVLPQLNSYCFAIVVWSVVVFNELSNPRLERGQESFKFMLYM